jgi:hypothetical protein
MNQGKEGERCQKMINQREDDRTHQKMINQGEDIGKFQKMMNQGEEDGICKKMMKGEEDGICQTIMNRGEEGRRCQSMMIVHDAIGRMLMIGGNIIRGQTATMLIQSMTAQTRSKEVLEMSARTTIPLLNTVRILNSVQMTEEDMIVNRAGN